VTYMHQSYMLSVIDTESWQEFADSCTHQTAESGTQNETRDFWMFVEQRRAVWIGDRLLLTEFPLSFRHRDLVCIAAVTGPWKTHGRIYLYAKQVVVAEARQSRNATQAVLLFGEVLRALNGRVTQQPRASWNANNQTCIQLKGNTSIEWIVKTNERWNNVEICHEIHIAEMELSRDQIQWITTHVKRLGFINHGFNEATAKWLSHALAQGNCMVEDLELLSGFGDNQAMSNTFVLRSLQSMFQRQTPCSLISLSLYTQQYDSNVVGEFVDALAHYQGDIQHVELGVGKCYKDWLPWYETMMKSTIITNVTFLLEQDPVKYGDIPVSHRLRMPLLNSSDNIKDVQILARGKLIPEFDEIIQPILQCRRVARKLVQLTSTYRSNMDGGDDANVDESTTNCDGLIEQVLLSQERVWQDARTLYRFVHSHNNVFIDLWKQGGPQRIQQAEELIRELKRKTHRAEYELAELRRRYS